MAALKYYSRIKDNETRLYCVGDTQTEYLVARDGVLRIYFLFNTRVSVSGSEIKESEGRKIRTSLLQKIK